jgi:hypothetical protein
MTVGPGSPNTSKRFHSIIAAAVAILAAGGLAVLSPHGHADVAGPTVGEKLAAPRAERAGLQARADGAARIDLVAAFRAASLLSDARIASRADRESAFGTLPAERQGVFGESGHWAARCGRSRGARAPDLQLVPPRARARWQWQAPTICHGAVGHAACVCRATNTRLTPNLPTLIRTARCV